MAVVFVKEIEKNVFLGVWRFDESLDSLLHSVNLPKDVCSLCESRKRETASVYALITAMTGENDFVVGHYPSGRPFLHGYNIGISHTKQYAAVILSTTRRVSTDIEYLSDRVVGIANRFLRDDEMQMMGMIDIDGSKPHSSCLHLLKLVLLSWCAKETMFKYYSDARLTFENMRVSGLLSVGDSGSFSCDNLLNGEHKNISFDFNDDFCLTYMIE